MRTPLLMSVTPPPPNARSKLARRRSPLLLLVAALVAAALSVSGAPPASADHGRDTEVWSATLTAQSTGTGPGCDSSSATVATRCSTATTLTDNQFTYLGVNYRVDQIAYTNGVLSMSFDKDIPDSFKRLTLYIGGVRTSLADADVAFTLLSPSAASQSSVSALSVGDTRSLRLVRHLWTGVDLYGGDMVHQADGAQYMDLNEGNNGTFRVRLDRAPTAEVTITIGKLSTFEIDDFDAATVSPQTLTFTTSNWQTGQSVTVTAATDGDGDDDRIIISARVSIASGADADDPYRNPERVNGFVLTVTDTTVGGG